MCPEAPGPSTGDRAGPSPCPEGPPKLQEAGPQLPGMEAADVSSEAQWPQADHKVPPALRVPPVLAPTLATPGIHPMWANGQSPGDPDIPTAPCTQPQSPHL